MDRQKWAFVLILTGTVLWWFGNVLNPEREMWLRVWTAIFSLLLCVHYGLNAFGRPDIWPWRNRPLSYWWRRR